VTIKPTPELLHSARPNPMMLPQNAPRRGLLAPDGTLPPTDKFIASYETDVLFYDVFRDAHGDKVILIGPGPIDLAPLYRSMKAVAQPSGKSVRIKDHHSVKVQLYSAAVPKDTTHLDISFAGTVQRIAIAPNHSEFFAGQNLLFTLSKNNDLQWIADWARFHVANQGVTAVLMFDNASDRYTIEELQATLLEVEGLDRIGVVPVPFRYSGPDQAMKSSNKFWAHFLQPATFTGMFRRYGAMANGILNCDVDELAVPTANETVFETANASRSGTVYFRNLWVEPVPEAEKPSYRRADFRLVKAEADYRRGPTQNWALTPNRPWLRNLKIHPYTHLLKNRPMLTRHKPDTAYIAHFTAISTSWKYDRPVVLGATDGLRPEPSLSAALDRAFPELS
jgi:hypothetical protein